MSALPADIRRATRRSQIVTREDASILARFPAARDQVNAPEPGYFESAADAATVLALKADLTGKFRRRYIVQLDDMIDLDPFEGIPTWEIADTELGLEVAKLVTRYEIDLEEETTTYEGVG